MRRARVTVAALVMAPLLTTGPSDAAVAYVTIPSGGVVPSVTAMTFAGGQFYGVSYLAGRILRMPVLPGGLLGPPEIFVTNLTNPLGVAVAPDGTVFAADSHTVGNRTVGRVRALPPTGGNANTVGQIVVDNLPNGRHNTNNLIVFDGRLYITNGNSTDDGISGGPAEQALSGTVLSTTLAARNVDGSAASADLVVEAFGLRNIFDVAVRPGTRELWTASNGPDAVDPYGEDLLHKLTIDENPVDFGFPACIYRAGPGGPTDPIFIQNTAITTRTCDAATHRKPQVTLGLHVSADGLDFAPTTGGWQGELFISEFGSLDPAQPAGHAIVRVPITNGQAGAPQTILVGAAPLEATFGPAGLYVGDFGSGQITIVLPVG